MFVPEDKQQADEEDNPVPYLDFSRSLKERRNWSGDGSEAFQVSLSTETTPTPGELSLSCGETPTSWVLALKASFNLGRPLMNALPSMSIK